MQPSLDSFFGHTGKLNPGLFFFSSDSKSLSADDTDQYVPSTFQSLNKNVPLNDGC